MREILNPNVILLSFSILSQKYSLEKMTYELGLLYEYRGQNNLKLPKMQIIRQISCLVEPSEFT